MAIDHNDLYRHGNRRLVDLLDGVSRHGLAALLIEATAVQEAEREAHEAARAAMDKFERAGRGDIADAIREAITVDPKKRRGGQDQWTELRRYKLHCAAVDVFRRDTSLRERPIFAHLATQEPWFIWTADDLREQWRRFIKSQGHEPARVWRDLKVLLGVEDE